MTSLVRCATEVAASLPSTVENRRVPMESNNAKTVLAREIDRDCEIGRDRTCAPPFTSWLRRKNPQAWEKSPHASRSRGCETRYAMALARDETARKARPRVVAAVIAQEVNRDHSHATLAA